MDDDDHLAEADEAPRYANLAGIDPLALSRTLCQLTLLGDDPYLRMQAFNLAVVDQFVGLQEYELLKLHREKETTPVPEAIFVSAISQMWIFAAYELLRTWRQRAREILRLSEDGALQAHLEELERGLEYQHFGRQIRAEQVKGILNKEVSLEAVERDSKRTHICFARLEALRVILAKHEIRRRKKSVALMPGYGRINQWCGSLDFELENGLYSMGSINRRDIADEIRAFGENNDPPSDEIIREFENFMRGKDVEPPRFRD